MTLKTNMVRAAVLACLGLLLAIASPAAAGEVTRASYREAAEPICQANTKANERILAGARAEVRGGKLRPAAGKFARAAAALKATVGELRALPQPSADQARLAKWLGYAATEASLFEAAARKLRDGNKGAAEHLVARLTQTANRANTEVLAFEFHYCRFEPSRFT